MGEFSVGIGQASIKSGNAYRAQIGTAEILPWSLKGMEAANGSLFMRDWAVRIGTPASGDTINGIDVSELDIEFKVSKDLTAKPNECELTIHNLRQESRDILDAYNLYDPKKSKKSSSGSKGTKQAKRPKNGKIRVEIEAGYRGLFRPLIFLGDLRNAVSELQQDGSWTTTIRGSDNALAIQVSRVSRSFEPGARHIDVVRALTTAMGVGTGNILQVADLLQEVYPHGTVVDGQASAELTRVLRGAGVAWSIQDGSVQFLRRGAGAFRQAVLLNANSGLVGSPQRQTTGLVLVRSLINPFLACGQYVTLESQSLSGDYYVSKITYSGSTFGQDWYADCELQPGTANG